MIWEQYFLTRFAVVMFSMIASIFWLILGLVNGLNGVTYDPVCVLLLLHSLGMIGLSAGMFGQRIMALFVTLIVGLMWFAATVMLLLIGLQSDFDFFRHPLEMIILCLQTCSGFALFFITWLLLYTSRQTPGDFREF